MASTSIDTIFDLVIADVLAHEGGFVDHPKDPGGATSYGISLRFLTAVGMLDADQDGFPDGDFDADGKIDVSDIRRMSRAQAVSLYRVNWWDRYGYAELQISLAKKLMNFSVNMGPGGAGKIGAHTILQRACRACGSALLEDGVLGPKTRAAIQAIPLQALLPAFRAEAAGRYRELVACNSSLAPFLNGWLARAYA